MAKPEALVKKRINYLLAKYEGLYKFMPVQSGIGAKSLDYLICYRGRFIGIEAKAGNNLPTPLQLDTIDRILDAGGITLVVNEFNLNKLEALLDELTNVPIG
jgi:hypothetical protein